MARSIVGARIRERRRALGLTQAELAQRVGISASYLNLIERNRRGIAGRRLSDIAGALGLRLSDLDGAAELRLHETLEAIAADPRLASLGVEAEVAGELIGRYPGWARALGALARAEQDNAQMMRAFADRLAHDPYLGETVHRMLTHISAIRSTAEILEEVPDIDPAQARRFQVILAEESRRLSAVGEALAAYFDKSATPARRVTPVDEVEALFEERENHFAPVEAALAGAAPAPTEQAARALAELRAGPVIDRLVAEAEEIETAPARNRARAALLRYAMDAARAPLGPFAMAAAALDYDIELVAGREGLPVDLVCRRLTSLPAAPGRPRFGYVAVNAAGAMIELRGLRGFHPVRNAPYCPRWVLARAAQAPERALRQLVAFPDGRRHVFVARARPTGPAGFGRPRHLVTDMLVIPEAEAGATVYGERAGGEAPPEEVGPTCRICPRKRCAERVEDPLVGDLPDPSGPRRAEASAGQTGVI